MPDPAPAWADALRVAALLAADGHGCGGAVVRAGAGPVRERWLDALKSMLPPGTPWRRMPAGVPEDRLLGGLDLTATLRAGRPMAQTGLLAEADGGVVVVPMAERLAPGTLAHLAQALDTGAVALERDGSSARLPARVALVLLDEGAEDETVAEALADRLAFRIDLSGLGLRDIGTSHSPPRPHPEVPARSGGLEGGLQITRWPLEPSFEARLRLAPQDEGEDGYCADEGQEGKTASDGESGGVDELGTRNEVPNPVALLCAAAADLGVASLRGPLLALRVARLLGERAGRSEPGEGDVIEAACLVLAPRATRLPAPPERAEAEPPPAESEAAPPPEPPSDASPPSESPPDETRGDDSQKTLDEVVLEAARAAIPQNLLARLLAGGPPLRDGRAGRAGQATAAPRKGRPVGSRPGDPRRGRLDLIATLRAAAPWQRLRRLDRAGGEPPPSASRPPPLGGEEGRERPASLLAPFLAPWARGTARSAVEWAGPHPGRRILVRPDDLRIKKLRQKAETTTIFCVDASGSAALERLAEAKGAVELLLAEAYVRRDRVALIAFRGRGAEVMLPPTRSLVRAKRALAGLPGGGGTPLAAGLDMAATLALQVRRGGGSPVVVVLTDGRANVARSGEGGRALAGEEALASARALRSLGLAVLVIDTGARPDGARRLAGVARARYCPMPYADAGALGAAVRAATG